MTKAEIVSAIQIFLGISSAASLEKASKADLLKVLEALQKMNNKFDMK